MTKATHNLIATTAKNIAREAYESIAHDNTFYAEWPNREGFVRRNWPMFVDAAREALLKILAGDYPAAMKEPIYEAMLIDGSMKAENTQPAPKGTLIH
jgi:hypothetical protein